MSKTYTLKVLSGVVINGIVCSPGAIVRDVGDKLTRQLLNRGKVALATAEDVGEPADDDADAEDATAEDVGGDAKPRRGRPRKATTDDTEGGAK